MCWWGSQARNDGTQKAVKLYMEKNPNVDIKMEFMDWTGYWDKMSTMAAGKSLPDIVQMDYAYLNQYAESGQLTDLDPFIKDKVIDDSKFQKDVLDSGSVDGKCYALSLGIQPPCMVYDKEIIEMAGIEMSEYPTWEEVYDIGQKIYDKTGVSTFYDGGINGMILMARSQGKYLYDEIKNEKSDVIKKHFENVDKFNKAEFSISPDLLAEKDPSNIDTKPIIDQTTWNDLPFACQYPSIADTAGRELGVCFNPKPADSIKEQNYLKPTMFFSISQSSKQKEEAAKFLDWFVNDNECNLILKAERGIPINTDVSDSVKEISNDNTIRVFDLTTKSNDISSKIDKPDPAGRSEMDAQLNTIVEDLRNGDLTPDEATDEFMSQAKEILDSAAEE